MKAPDLFNNIYGLYANDDCVSRSDVKKELAEWWQENMKVGCVDTHEKEDYDETEGYIKLWKDDPEEVGSQYTHSISYLLTPLEEEKPKCEHEMEVKVSVNDVAATGRIIIEQPNFCPTCGKDLRWNSAPHKPQKMNQK